MKSKTFLFLFLVSMCLTNKMRADVYYRKFGLDWQRNMNLMAHVDKDLFKSFLRNEIKKREEVEKKRLDEEEKRRQLIYKRLNEIMGTSFLKDLHVLYY